MARNLPFRYWSEDDLRNAGVEINAALVSKAAKIFWKTMKAGETRSLKAPMLLNREELWSYSPFKDLKTRYDGEKIDFRHATLIGEIPGWVGTKDLHSSPLRRHIGEERQSSLITLWGKCSGKAIGIIDGTSISSLRTGYYAAKGMELAFPNEVDVKVFVFGTGPVAKAAILALGEAHGDKVASLAVRGTGYSSIRLVDEVKGHVPFQLLSVLDMSECHSLAEADYIITATNHGKPLFSKEDISPNAVTMSLGIDDMSSDYLDHVLQNGRVACDDVEQMSHRNVNALPLHFSRRGETLEDVASCWGIKNFVDMEPFNRGDRPTHFTCAGLAALDVMVALHALCELAEKAGMALPTQSGLTPYERCQ